MFRLLIMLMLLSATPIVAQDSEIGDSSSTEPSAEKTDAESADDSAEVIDADEVGESDTYSEADEGDFIPSDEVTYEQSVPFPTDI